LPTSAKLGLTIVVLLLTLLLSRFSRSRFRSALQRSGLQLNVAILIARLLWMVVWLIGLGVIISVLGIGLTPFAALIGVVGLAASLAFQQVLQNLVAGVYLLAERPFAIGDRIDVAGAPGANHEGIVEDIQMRTTHLRNVHDELILIPNSTIFSGVVTNRTAVGGYMSNLNVTFPRSIDPGEVRTRIIPLLQKLPGVLESPPADLRVEKAGKDDWTASVLYWVTRNEATATAVWAVADAFPEATVSAGVET
jgi:small conductance mechanosensitive channel